MFSSSSSSQRKLTILGAIAIGAVIAVAGFGVVRADITIAGTGGVFDCNSGSACVLGHAFGQSPTKGVFGFSNSADGVQGLTRSVSGQAGVHGVSHGTLGTAYGVVGFSSNGDGVSGASMGRKLASGVRGISNAGDGVSAESTGAGAAAIHSLADNAGTYIFVGVNPKNHANCTMDPSANLTCTGTVSGGTLQSQHRNSRGERVIAYAPESASATIEDVGTARMIGGIANVRLDPSFAAMTDRRWYYVFLTPLGDTRGLYVSLKTASGFQVRETERGRGNLEFDYRIVAHPIDGSNDRLPPAAGS